LIIISRPQQGTLPETKSNWKEIQDHPWVPSSLDCIQINVKKTSQEGLRNTLSSVLSEPRNRNTAVVFVQGIIHEDISKLKRLLPQNYKLIQNRTENNGENVEGFSR